jgi:hypothetical protein
MISSTVVLPHPFSGDVIARTGATLMASYRYVITIQSARMISAWGGRTA